MSERESRKRAHHSGGSSGDARNHRSRSEEERVHCDTRDREHRSERREGGGEGREGGRSTQVRPQLWVGGLPQDASEEELRDMFKQFGDLSALRIAVDSVTRKSKGFCFVSFVDEAHASLAAQTALSLGRHPLTVRVTAKGGAARPVHFPTVVARTTQEHAPSALAPPAAAAPTDTGNECQINVVCAKRVSADDLYEQFEGFGEIVQCTVQADRQGVSKGIASLVFDNPRSALLAVQHMDGVELYGKELKVTSACSTVTLPTAAEGEIGLEDMDDGGVVLVETVDEQEHAERKKRVAEAVAQSLVQAKGTLVQIDAALQEHASGRQYNEEEYDY